MLYLVNNRLLLINNGNSLYRIDNQTQPEPDSNPFIFTIDTTLGTGSSFNLPLRSGFEYDFVVDWGDGSSNIITSYNQAEKLHTYSTGGVYTISITGLCEAWFSYFSADRLKLTSIDQWGNTGFVNMENAFFGCDKLTTVNDIDGTWCSSVTNMQSMFMNCESLTTLDVSTWDVFNVTDMNGMFFGCSSLTTLDVSTWDVSNVTNMGGMFGNCSLLTTLDVSTWDVSNVTIMTSMFFGCSSLTTLDVSTWDVSNVTDMQQMFMSCESLTTLDVSTWDVSNVEDMQYMFLLAPLDTPSYDALLIGWSQLPSLQSNVNLYVTPAKYSAGAAADARQYIIDTYKWFIQDGGQVV